MTARRSRPADDSPSEAGSSVKARSPIRSGRQVLPATGATGAQDLATANRGSARAKTVAAGANKKAGLKCALHRYALLRSNGAKTRMGQANESTCPTGLHAGIRRRGYAMCKVQSRWGVTGAHRGRAAGPPPTLLSDEKLGDPFADQGGLVLAFDLHRDRHGLLPLTGTLFVKRDQFEMAAHALARTDG